MASGRWGRTVKLRSAFIPRRVAIPPQRTSGTALCSRALHRFARCHRRSHRRGHRRSDHRVSSGPCSLRACSPRPCSLRRGFGEGDRAGHGWDADLAPPVTSGSAWGLLHVPLRPDAPVCGAPGGRGGRSFGRGGGGRHRGHRPHGARFRTGTGHRSVDDDGTDVVQCHHRPEGVEWRGRAQRRRGIRHRRRGSGLAVSAHNGEGAGRRGLLGH